MPKFLDKDFLTKKKEERDAALLKLYAEAEAKGDINFTELGAQIGVGGAQVRNILREHGIEAVSTAKRGRKKMVGQQPLSLTHHRIGQKLLEYRKHDLSMSTTEFAIRLNMSANTITGIEHGVHDPTLCELQKLSKEMGYTVQELVKERE